MKDQLILIYSYLHGIWVYRWSALIICWLVALVGWALVFALPNQYTSKAILHIDTTSVMTPLLDGLAVESEVDVGLGIMSKHLFSRKNLEEVIRQTDMGMAVGGAAAMDALVYNIGRSITFKSDGRQAGRSSNIYELSYQGESPKMAYQITSKLLNTLIETMVSSARTDTAEAQIFLDRQIAAYEVRLIDAEQELSAFKRANIGYMPDERGGYYSRLQREQDELKDIQSALRLAKRRHSEMRKQLGGESPLLDNNRHAGSRALRLRQFREQLDVLLSQFTEKHPDIQALRASIADVMSSDKVPDEQAVSFGVGDTTEFNPVYQELKAEIHRASIEVETLKIRLEDQESSVEALKQAVDTLPQVEAKLAKLNRDYEITRERHLDLIERRESARLAQEVGLSGSNIKFKIIESPRVATKPSGPKRQFLLSMVFLMAIGIGLAWGFLRYLIQPTFIDSSQLSGKIDLPLLGSVGLFLTPQHKKKRLLQLMVFLLFFSLLAIFYVGALVFSSELLHALTSLKSYMI